MTTALFNLKKTNPKNVCDAMRCPDAPHDTTAGDLWARENVSLCAKHLSLALTFAEHNPDYEPAAEVVEAPPNAALAKVAVGEAVLPSTWLDRAQEVVALITGSKSEADEQLELAKAFQIENHEDFEMVATMTREVKTIRDQYETMEKEITQPLNAAVKKIRFILASSKTAWTEVESVLRGKMRDATLREAERNSEIVKQAAATAAAGGDAVAVVQNMTMSSDIQGVSNKIVWKHVVENVEMLPPEYQIKLPDDKKLKAYAESFEGDEPPTPIAGVRFERDTKQRVQSVKN